MHKNDFSIKPVNNILSETKSLPGFFLVLAIYILIFYPVLLFAQSTWAHAYSGKNIDSADSNGSDSSRGSINNLQNANNYHSLSIEERIKCYSIIEKIYWNHRIWPAQNSQPKPDFNSIIPESAIRSKVEDILRKSNAIEHLWNQQITDEMLHAEIEHIAKNTRQPDVLKEIWNSLNNDSHLIAECMARPLIADRFIHNWYSFDVRFHGQLKRNIEADLKRYRDTGYLHFTGGTVKEIVWVLESLIKGKGHVRDKAIVVNENSWNNIIDSLALEFDTVDIRRTSRDNHKAPLLLPPRNNKHSIDQLPLNILSPLKEDETSFYVASIKEKNNKRLKVEYIVWKKKPFDEWWNQEKYNFGITVKEYNAEYPLPAISMNGCTGNTWQITGLEERLFHTAVWTGAEMVIWGGQCGTILNTGWKYYPATDSWTRISDVNAPEARTDHTAVWTGTEMIVWGGWGLDYYNSGGRYNLATDSWTATSLVNAPDGRVNFATVWTGTEMIIWGGQSVGNYIVNNGSRYNPSSNTWTATSLINAPTPRSSHVGVWSGTEMIIWGGFDGTDTITGGRYNPVSNIWTSTSTVNAPAGRTYFDGVWTGTEMIIWGGGDAFNHLNTGGRYNPISNSWTATSIVNAPSPRIFVQAIWSGSVMIVWGGMDLTSYLNSGGRYDPSNDTWAATSTINAPGPRYDHSVVWTGTEMIIWGGRDQHAPNTGGRYNPVTDTWLATSTMNIPKPRGANSAVWTGSEMIIWGGHDYSLYYNTGGSYQPVTDNWIPMSTLNAPSERADHSTIWTGLEMIIWGGSNGIDIFATGGKYNVVQDSWQAITDVDAPSNRYGHTTVWTGSEMLLWGGTDNSTCFDNGNRYNPNTDAWGDITQIGAPSGRTDHTALWSGTEMIVWGGSNSSNSALNTGGRFNPALNTWSATSSMNSPAARRNHTAVWAGTNMIIWGGEDINALLLNTGGIYYPVTDEWIATSTINVPSERRNHIALWTGEEMIIWGGESNYPYPSMPTNTGARYSPVVNSWTATSLVNAPTARLLFTAIWTGTQMIIWGGDHGPYTSTGALYCDATGIAPGTVPDNDNFPGIPLTIMKSGASSLELNWGIPGGSCQTQDYGIYRGTLPWITYNHSSVLCSTGSAASATIPADAGSYYYLIVAQIGGKEGSYGLNSSNVQRPAAASSCLVQEIGTCN